MGSGSLRELLVLEKIAFGGVYVTDPVLATFLDPKLTLWSQKCVTVEARHAHRKIKLLTVMHSGTSAFRKRRQLRILGPGSWAVACCVSSSN